MAEQDNLAVREKLVSNMMCEIICRKNETNQPITYHASFDYKDSTAFIFIIRL